MKKTKKEIKADGDDEVVETTDEVVEEAPAEEAPEEAPAEDGEKSVELTPEALSDMISKSVNDAVAPLKNDFKRKSFNVVSSETKELEKLQGIEKAGRFLQALGKGEMAVVKALSEGVGADGGFLVPVEFRNIVHEKLHKLGVVRPWATIVPMSRDKLEVPVEDGGVTSAYIAENSPLSESNNTWTQLVLDTNKLTALSKMSRELVADNAVNLVNYVANQFAISFSKTENDKFTNGAGSTEPTGFRTYTYTATGAQAGANLVGDDLIDLYYSLPSQYRANAIWQMPNSVIAVARKLKDLDGQYLWTDGFGETPATIMGRPVIENNDIPTNLGVGTDESEVYFGDFSNYYIGDRQTMEVEQSTEAGDAFVNHQLWIKAVMRNDGQLALEEGIAQLTAVK